jgi:hypothetical protein
MRDHSQPSQPAAEPEFLNTAELLQRLPVSRRTAYAMRDSGRLPFVRLERKILYHWPSVRDALLRRQQTEAANAR